MSFYLFLGNAVRVETGVGKGREKPFVDNMSLNTENKKNHLQWFILPMNLVRGLDKRQQFKIQ